MKKLIALLLAAIMVLILGACVKENPTETTLPEVTENQVYTEPSQEDAEPFVYLLNHDAAMDAAWQSLAEAYEKEFGVSVKVITAAEAYYAETLAEELNKDEHPTLFYGKDAQSLAGLEDTCLDLAGTELADAAVLTLGEKKVGVPIPAEEAGAAGYWCINAGASKADVDATAAFLNWALTSQAEMLFPQNG